MQVGLFPGEKKVGGRQVSLDVYVGNDKCRSLSSACQSVIFPRIPNDIQEAGASEAVAFPDSSGKRPLVTPFVRVLCPFRRWCA